MKVEVVNHHILRKTPIVKTQKATENRSSYTQLKIHKWSVLHMA